MGQYVPFTKISITEEELNVNPILKMFFDVEFIICLQKLTNVLSSDKITKDLANYEVYYGFL